MISRSSREHAHRLAVLRTEAAISASVPGEGERHCRGKSGPLKVVTICNHLIVFGAIEVKSKIGGKSLRFAFDLLVQADGGHCVERGEVGIDYDLLAVDDEDLAGDARGNDEC